MRFTIVQCLQPREAGGELPGVIIDVDGDRLSHEHLVVFSGTLRAGGTEVVLVRCRSVRFGRSGAGCVRGFPSGFPSGFGDRVDFFHGWKVGMSPQLLEVGLEVLKTEVNQFVGVGFHPALEYGLEVEPNLILFRTLRARMVRVGLGVLEAEFEFPEYRFEVLQMYGLEGASKILFWRVSVEILSLAPPSPLEKTRWGWCWRGSPARGCRA